MKKADIYGNWRCCAVACCAVFMLAAGCGKPVDVGNNYTNCWITVLSINGNEPLQADVLSKGVPKADIITIQLKSVFRALEGDATAPNGATPFDSIIFHSYLVTHRRSDGGANPASFSGGINLLLEADSEGEIKLVVVRAFDKNRSPLLELRDDGEIFTTSIITLYGNDGNGNDVAVDASLTISFANFIDS